eukprot:4255007-Amphidinium_carterae.1
MSGSAAGSGTESRGGGSICITSHQHPRYRCSIGLPQSTFKKLCPRRHSIHTVQRSSGGKTEEQKSGIKRVLVKEQHTIKARAKPGKHMRTGKVLCIATEL